MSWTANEVRKGRKGLLEKGRGPSAKAVKGLGMLGLARA